MDTFETQVIILGIVTLISIIVISLRRHKTAAEKARDTARIAEIAAAKINQLEDGMISHGKLRWAVEESNTSLSDGQKLKIVYFPDNGGVFSILVQQEAPTMLGRSSLIQINFKCTGGVQSVSWHLGGNREGHEVSIDQWRKRCVSRLVRHILLLQIDQILNFGPVDDGQFA